ncbi:MAG: 2-C-methyl-D-erythritol 4-phosphate cytidylyltransferase [Akkermansiaceae bacterium]
MLSVIIVAAGNSRRMGFDKLMAPLHGKPVLAHSLKTFLESPDVTEVILVSTSDRLNELAISNDKLKLTSGGQNRHDSVSNGIAAVSADAKFIAVHDGARPFITQEQIHRTLEAAQQHGAAASATRITDTVKRSNSENFATESISRDNLWAMETPQIFNAELLKKAYHHVETSGTLVTDEVSALELIGTPTYLVENPTPNTKITYPKDLDFV